MALRQPINRFNVGAINPLMKAVIAFVLWFGLAGGSRAQDAQPTNTQESSSSSSTSTATQASMDTNPLRKSESHSTSGNRSIDKQRVEVLGTDGSYKPDYEIETETVRVNSTTTRTAVRTYKWDANGQRNLVLLTEEEARSSSGGNDQVVRTTSSRDVNGNLQLVQREVADTKKTSPDAQETKTTVYLADGNGGFTPSRQTQELQKSGADHSVEVKKTTLVPGANGNWQVDGVTEKTITEDGKNRVSDERVSRPDLDGRLSEVSRTVDKETETAAGEKSNTVETYSTDGAGVVVDGSLHLNQRVTTVQNKDSDHGTVQHVEQPNPGNPTDGLQVSSKTKYTVKYAASGSQQTKTVQVRDGSGNFSVYSAETKKSEQVSAAQAPAESTDKPK
jgi:hypothetical protein